MDVLSCELECFSSTPHLSQIYTGFGILNNRQAIKATLKKRKDYNPTGMQFLSVTLNKQIKLFYDLEDHDIINQKHIAECDFYFKRSYNVSSHRQISAKIFPYGFNYPVTGSKNFAFRQAMWEAVNISDFYDLYKLIKVRFMQRNTNKISKFEDYPKFDENPKILFLARLWDPDKQNQEELKEERLAINHTRAECVRKLRAKFGKNFIGGFSPEPFALKNYRDCVVDSKLTEKANYLQTIKDTSICVATMGLRKSNGFKIAEYVAGSKAIVSEKLHYQPTGNFENGKNYLEFTSADGCVERVGELFYDAEKRRAMKRANYNYYQEYLRPDILVWNTLQIARCSIQL